MWNSSQVSWLSELNTERLPPLQPHCSDSTPWWCLLRVPQPSGCASQRDQLAVSSHTAHGCRGCWYTFSWVRCGESWAQKQRGGEWVSQDKAGGWKRPVELFNRAERKHVQINHLCTFAERAVIYCQCVTLSTWVLAWLKDPELWSIVGQTNTSYCRRFISFPGLKSLLGNRRSVRSFALQRSCAPCRQMNFLRTPDQLKLAGIPKLAQCKPHS